jgi:hypothetical protein
VIATNVGTTTIGSGVTILGGGTVGNNNGSQLIDLQGTIRALDAARTTTVYNLTNNGLLESLNGSTLTLTGTNLTNNSTLTVNGSTLNLSATNWSTAGPTIGISNSSTVNLGGNFTTAIYELLNPVSSTINLTGNLDNTGDILTFTPTTGDLYFKAGEIIGGDIRTAGGSLLFDGNGTLDGVTLDTNFTVDNGRTLTIQNGLTLGGSVVPTPTLTMGSTGNTTSLSFSGAGQTLGGTGTIDMSTSPNNNNRVIATQPSDCHERGDHDDRFGGHHSGRWHGG